MGRTGIIIFIVLATIIFLLFIAGLFLFLLQYRKRIIMHENEKQLLALNSMLQGQQEERTRLAKDLHDGLGGMLSGIKLNLSSIADHIQSPEKDKQLFLKSIHQLDNAITEMRRVAHNMMPEALLKFGLVEATRDFCQNINESGIIKMKFMYIGELQMEQSREIIIYRIIQELANNCIKHANPANIIVQLTRGEQEMMLTVEDDGKGFVPGSSNGAGLKNVQTRVDYLKGNLNIESAPGKGTSITIEIPN